LYRSFAGLLEILEMDLEMSGEGQQRTVMTNATKKHCGLCIAIKDISAVFKRYYPCIISVKGYMV